MARRSLLAIGAMVAVGALSMAFTNEPPTMPAPGAVGYGYCSCPARPDVFKVHIAIFSTKPTEDQGPLIVCDCAYDDEPLLFDSRLESVCSAWASPAFFDGQLHAPACIAQTTMLDANHRSFGPCDASCNYPTTATRASSFRVRRAARRAQRLLELGAGEVCEGPADRPRCHKVHWR